MIDGTPSSGSARLTISILARDPESGHIGGAAATGSLCVGGWVLRGDPRAGMSASQGTAPSTLWGDGVLARMAAGARAADAVTATVAPDPGRGHRQLAALDLSGRGHAFTGGHSVPVAGAEARPGAIAAGNMLSNDHVVGAALDGFLAAGGDLAERLLAGLRAAHEAGSDSRGLRSAALLVLGRDMAPLSLRLDMAADPLSALAALLAEAQSPPYADWLREVPTLETPWRAPESG